LDLLDHLASFGFFWAFDYLGPPLRTSLLPIWMVLSGLAPI
jgi:hypothetical protein